MLPLRRKDWIALTCVLVAIISVVVFLNRGLTVRIRNVGSTPLRSVVVRLRTNTYPLGELPAGGSASIGVQVPGESSVVVEFKDDSGTNRTLDADCYLERHHQGTLSVELTSQAVTRVGLRVFP